MIYMYFFAHPSRNPSKAKPETLESVAMFMRNFHFIAALFVTGVVSSGPAFAEKPRPMNPALHHTTDRPFAFRMQMPIYVTSNLDEIKIYVDTETCLKALERIQQTIRTDYKYAYPKNEAEKSNRIFDDIQDLLKSPVLSKTCRETANQVYALVAPLGLPNSLEGSYIFLETLNLFQMDLLRPLTPQLRDELGGEWRKKSLFRKNQYQIMGAYDCLQSIVWFDPSQRPFDLAATLAHEVEHFYQDKITHWENSNDFTPARIADTLNIDESLATLHSSFAQFIQDREFNRDFYRRNGEERHFQPKKPFRYFTLGLDNTLYSQNGILDALWKSQTHFFKDTLYTSHPLLLRALHELPPPEDIRWDEVSEGTKYFKRLPPSFRALYELSNKIRSAYFLGNVSSPNRALRRIQLEFKRRPLMVLPLAGLSFAHQEFSKGEYKRTAEIIGESTFEKLRAEKNHYPRPIELYFERGFSPSEGCREFTRLAKEGRIDDYLGTRLGGKQSGGDGVRPGGDGVRPGGDGVRPGGDGVRPGGDGVRPGGDGVRPGGDGVRPGGDGVRPGGDGVRPGGDGVRPSTQTYPCLHPETWGGI